MRLFITVNMDTDVQDEIMDIIPIIKTNIRQGKYVPKENMHITMLFIGEVEDGQVSTVERVIESAVAGIEPFELWVEDLGVFPNEQKPNILWAGVKGELNSLNKLYDQLLSAIKTTGLPFDAKPKYTPHLTIARKIGTGYQKGAIKLKTMAWTVNSLDLYQSILLPDGVKYQRIFRKSF